MSSQNEKGENCDVFFLETNNKNDGSCDEKEKIESKSKRENGLLDGEEDESTKDVEQFNENNHLDHKRQRPTQSVSSSGISNAVPDLGISPPNFISFEEIMKTANDMSRMALMNEIVLNKDFKLEKKKDSNGLEKVVRENMQKAFWNILTEQLKETPTNYRQAISLLCEIKENLLEFLMPQHTQLKAEINEVLDIELIKQQAENGVFEFQRFAQYVLSVCSRLCCPARDEMIRKLTQTTELIPLMKGIFDLLEAMKIDFTNFCIKQFRPHIQSTSVEYEQEKFKSFLETHQKHNVDFLEYTTRWLLRNFETLDLSQEAEFKNILNKTLTASYIDLLKCIVPTFSCFVKPNFQDKQQSIDNKPDENESVEVIEDDFPETLLMIRNRIDVIREMVFKATLNSSIFVVTFAAIGEPLQSIKDFRLELKKQLSVIIACNEDKQKRLLQYMEQDELKSIMTNAALQVVKSIETALETYSVDPTSSKSFDDKKLQSLKMQITELASSNSRIRSVMERRILEFIERVISSSTAVPEQVPSGLSNFSPELTEVGGEFTRLVAYNRAVYIPYYTKVIARIASSKHYIPPNDVKKWEEKF